MYPVPPLAPDAPIQNLQEMLRLLAHVHRELPLPAPDGHFGETTLEAVMRFQQLMSLPVTGQVDGRTWDALTAEYDNVQRQLSPPQGVRLLPPYLTPLTPGQTSPLLYPIQGMFYALAPVFAPVQATPLSGVLDSSTAQNLRWVQHLGGQQETGALDKDTWELLRRIYETFVTRQAQAKQHTL